jgi:hypothetical protein
MPESRAQALHNITPLVMSFGAVLGASRHIVVRPRMELQLRAGTTPRCGGREWSAAHACMWRSSHQRALTHMHGCLACTGVSYARVSHMHG